ncbi:MAG TPA: DUF1800 domain-containing protein [Bryobacteraceae bacterium]|jgi:uncharacterized protein (DUF1800 family)
MSRNAVCAFALACSLAVPTLTVYAKKAKTPAPVPPAIPQMTSDQKILYALNRLAFGPRPGDVEAIKKIGLDKWIEWQLHPEAIRENPTLDAKLQPLDTLVLPADIMVESYPPPQLIRAMVDGRAPFPEDPLTRLMIRSQVERFNIQENAKAKKSPQAEAAARRVAEMSQEPSLEAVLASLTPDQQNIIKTGTQLEKVTLLDKLPPATQIEILGAWTRPQRQALFPLASPTMRRRINVLNGAQQITYQDLTEGKLLRAVYSNKQLEEVLTDFWFNHFNIYFDKGPDRYYTTSYERDVIREHMFGKFQDLLLADAQSPAMLYYLDNWESVGPNSMEGGNRNQKRGLNENYGRELMELHTLGVDGGYTQKDVTEVSRCFTGWTIHNPERGGQFEFNPRRHDNGEKIVLGVKIPAGGGMDDGLKVIDMLSKSPVTAHFISKSLAMRFVNDKPPAELIERMAKSFLATDGDLREVYRTMFTSPEFWSPDNFHAKVKTPLEMVASALRATNADIDYGFLIVQQLNVMGEPLYRKVEPTGYSLKNADWLNSAALLGRMNFSLALVSNRIPGIKVDLTPYQDAKDPNTVAHALLMTDLSERAKQAIQMGVDNPEILQQVNDRSEPRVQDANMMGMGRGRRGMDGFAPAAVNNKTALLAGLTLGSPDFQRR